MDIILQSGRSKPLMPFAEDGKLGGFDPPFRLFPRHTDPFVQKPPGFRRDRSDPRDPVTRHSICHDMPANQYACIKLLAGIEFDSKAVWLNSDGAMVFTSEIDCFRLL